MLATTIVHPPVVGWYSISHEICTHFCLFISYILSSVCLRLSKFSQLPFMQYIGLCAFSLPIFLTLILRIRVLYLIISIIRSEVWLTCPCLGFFREAIVCTVCLSLFLWVPGRFVWLHVDVMTWTYFRITGPLCGESTGRRCLASQKWTSDVDVYISSLLPWTTCWTKRWATNNLSRLNANVTSLYYFVFWFVYITNSYTIHGIKLPIPFWVVPLAPEKL